MQQEDINLQSYLDVLWRRKWAILSVFVVIIGLSLAGIAVSSTRYEAVTDIAVKNQPFYRPSVLGFSPGTDEASTSLQPESYVTLINGLTFAEKVTDALLKEGLPLDVAEVSGSIRAEYQEPDIVKIKAIRVVKDEAITLANVAAKVFEESTRETMNEQLIKGRQRALEFQEASRTEITELEGQIATLLQGLGVSDLASQTQTLREKVAGFERARGEQITKLEIAQAHRADLLARAETAATAGMDLADPRVDEYRKLQEQISEARVRYTESHPALKNLLDQSRAIEERLKETIAKSGSNLSPEAFLAIKEDLTKTDAEIADLERAVASWTRQISEVNAQLEQFPGTSAQLQTLQQRLATAQENFKIWSQRDDELRFKESMQPGNATVFNPATAAFPTVSKATLAVMACIFSLLMALGVGFLVEFADTTLRTPEEITNTIGVGYLGSIVKLKEQRQVVFQDGKAAHQAAESYTRIYSNIKFAQVEKPIRSLMVTSARKGEGKSTTLVNVACAIAAAGKRVIIVDTDLRNPTLQRILGSRHHAGLTSVLAGEAALDDVLRTTPHPGLMLLPAGPIPPNPSELLHSQAMKDIIAELEGRCDLVIFDSPPTLLVADAMLLGSELDAAIIVTEAGGVTRKMVQQVRDSLQTAKIRILGVILNKIVESAGSYYNYYSYYKYQEPDEENTGAISRIRDKFRRSGSSGA